MSLELKIKWYFFKIIYNNDWNYIAWDANWNSQDTPYSSCRVEQTKTLVILRLTIIEMPWTDKCSRTSKLLSSKLRSSKKITTSELSFLLVEESIFQQGWTWEKLAQFLYKMINNIIRRTTSQMWQEKLSGYMICWKIGKRQCWCLRNALFPSWLECMATASEQESI